MGKVNMFPPRPENAPAVLDDLPEDVRNFFIASMMNKRGYIVDPAWPEPEQEQIWIVDPEWLKAEPVQLRLPGIDPEQDDPERVEPEQDDRERPAED